MVNIWIASSPPVNRTAGNRACFDLEGGSAARKGSKTNVSQCNKRFRRVQLCAAPICDFENHITSCFEPILDSPQELMTNYLENRESVLSEDG